jgi:hypothetical protein
MNEVERDKEREEFTKALKRLPPEVSCFANGACCPWCGGLNKTVTFGMNNCQECGKEYAFGYPDWHEGKDPVSWVPFPWREFDALGKRADVLPEWKPNERLQRIYFQKTEERLGVYADERRAN